MVSHLSKFCLGALTESVRFFYCFHLKQVNDMSKYNKHTGNVSNLSSALKNDALAYEIRCGALIPAEVVL